MKYSTKDKLLNKTNPIAKNRMIKIYEGKMRLTLFLKKVFTSELLSKLLYIKNPLSAKKHPTLLKLDINTGISNENNPLK